MNLKKVNIIKKMPSCHQILIFIYILLDPDWCRGTCDVWERNKKKKSQNNKTVGIKLDVLFALPYVCFP